MSPAWARALVWWLTVGWDLPSGSSSSQRAHLVLGGDEAEQPEAHRVGEGGEDPGELDGLVLAERRGEHRAAGAVEHLDR